MIVETNGRFYLRAGTQELQQFATDEPLHLVQFSLSEPIYQFANLYQVAAAALITKQTDIGPIAPILAAHAASWKQEGGVELPRPDGLEPMPFQIAGVEYAMDRRRVLIGDEPGLGKTIQGILIANCMEARKVLVVCPAAVRLQWLREFNKWTTLENPITQAILNGKNQLFPGANLIVTSYDLIRSPIWYQTLYDWGPDLIITDEAHYLKTPDAKRTRAIFGGGEGFWKGKPALVDRASRFVALTGTPLPNRPREGYTLARHIDHSAIDFMSQERYETKYNPSVRLRTGHNLEHTDHARELGMRMRQFMVRRNKSDVLTQLPEKTYKLTFVEPNGAIRKALEAEKLVRFDPSTLRVDFVGDGEPIATARRLMGEAMVPFAIEHIRVILDGGEDKLVVFCHHIDVIKAIKEAFTDDAVVVRGGMMAKQREVAIRCFLHDPETKIFIGQTIATGTGLDGLQKVCRHALMVEPDWTPSVIEQAFDRIHRHGQRDGVLAEVMVAEGSIGQKIMNAVVSKAEIIGKTLGV